MITKNEILTLEIERFGGEAGIAHKDGMTLFVEGALPGERVEARVQKVEKTCAFLKTVSVLAPSADRALPPCPYYEKCGGCVAQHMTYACSLEMKRGRIEDALTRIGGLSVTVPPVLGMDDPWHYRNKTAMPVGGTPEHPLIGYYAPRSHRINDIPECPVAMDKSNEALRVFRLWMTKFAVCPYDEVTHKGSIRHFMTRVNRKGETMAVVVAAQNSLPHERELTAMLKAALPGLCSLYININKRGDNVILGNENRLLYGSERLEETLCGVRYALSPLSFFQINPVQTEKLYRTAVDFAGLKGDETVADLYCGAGTISLILAQKAKRVIGIEIVPEAIEDAKMNARANGIENATFYAAAAEELLPELVKKGLSPDAVVLDPPRKGCDPAVLEAICTCAPERVVYVSCDPATLARDLKYMTAHGYGVEKVQGVDMFCHTGHVETVILMSRVEK